MKLNPSSLVFHPDFRRFWAGDAVSQVGTAVTLVALPLVAITTLHASPFEAGLLVMFEYLAFLVIGLPAGAWVDRLRQRRVMIVCYLVRAVLFGSIPLAAYLGGLSLAQLYVVAFGASVCASFADVAAQSHLPRLVDGDQLMEANVKLEATRNIAQAGGPAAGGALIAALTAPMAIAVDAVSFGLSALLLSRVRRPEADPRRHDGATLRSEIAEGLRFVLGHRLLRAITVTAAMSNLCGTIGASMLLVLLAGQLHLSPSSVDWCSAPKPSVGCSERWRSGGSSACSGKDPPALDTPARPSGPPEADSLHGVSSRRHPPTSPVPPAREGAYLPVVRGVRMRSCPEFSRDFSTDIRGRFAVPQSFGQWLIVILALLVGLLGGWVLRGLRAAASPTAPIVEGDPVAGVTEVNAPATATVDQDRPEAVVDEVPAPAAVTEEPTPAEYDAPPAAATLAANATVLPGSDTEAAEEPERVDAAVPAPAEVDAAPVAAAEPAEIGSESVDATSVPVVETEPVAVEEPATPLVVEDEPTERPATVPAPRAAVEDDLPPVAAPDTAVTATPVASTAAKSNGSATTAEAADDFRRIQGIGPKMAAGLQAAGIRTYQQLAELDEAALRDTIKAAGLRATPSLATWPQQAKLLAGAGTDAGRVLPVGADEQA